MLEAGDGTLHEERVMLDDICRLAAHLLKAEVALIIEQGAANSPVKVFGSTGLSLEKLASPALITPLKAGEVPVVICLDLERQDWFRKHALRKVFAYTRGLVAASIELGVKSSAALIVINPDRTAAKEARMVSTLTSLTHLARYFILHESGEQSNKPQSFHDPEFQLYSLREGELRPPTANSDDLNTKFLVKTLVANSRLKKRHNAHYIALRSWRSSVKEFQIEALKILKSQPSAAAVAIIGTELADAAANVYAGIQFSAVVPIPCGSSGSTNCLSVQLAIFVAERLKAPFVSALLGQTATKGSHPRKSAQLKRYEATRKMDGPVLVVDDVASTGTHMELALTKLREAGASPFGIVWISG
jgi:predicted amidophosphoribosyltransferase